MSKEWRPLLFETSERGISSALAPELLADNQWAWGGNIDIRGGKPSTRPNINLRMNLPRGLIQGADYFGVQNGMIVASIAGIMYRLRVTGSNFSATEIAMGFVNSPVLKQVWMCQTVETLVIQDGQSDALLYDGSTAVRAGPGQVPRGKMMAYGNGRLWVVINNKELVAGDIRTRVAGSELKFTEVNYLTGGGALFFQRGLTGLAFIPVTGQADYGALLAYGLDFTNALRADVTQRDQWASIPGFEQVILRTVGGSSQWALVPVNQDIFWRDSNGGIRSIRNALADEAGPGSSPVSREVSRLTDFDSQQLLPWCSGVYHQNRLLMTSSPYLMPNGGVGWKDLISLDFAPLSTLQGKSQAAYNGQWNGLNFVKLVSGDFLGKSRAFALTTDDDGNNQLWEFGTGERGDKTGLCNSPVSIVEQPITCFLEYPRRNFGLAQNRKRLERCDVWLSDVDGPLELKAYWRADNSQQWLKWDDASTCAQTTDPSTATPHVWKNLFPQERPQFKTFSIPQGINEMVGYAAEVGFEFQIRLVWTGRCRIHRMMAYGTVLDEPNYALREEFQAQCIENDVQDNQVTYSIPTFDCAFIGVTQNASNIPFNGEFDFGETTVGTTVDKTFVIHNNGDQEITVGTVAISDGSGFAAFTILTQPDAVIPVGGTSPFQVRMPASQEGNLRARVSIPNSTDLNPFYFEIIGEVAGVGAIGYNYRSKSSAYTLCGFDELINPSVPPRKYLRQNCSGVVIACGSFPTGCDAPSAVNKFNYGGAAIFDPDFCGLDPNVNTMHYDNFLDNPGVCGGASTFNATVPLIPPLATSWNFVDHGTRVITRTTIRDTFDGVCYQIFTNFFLNEGSRVGSLVDEDTDIRAIFRKNATIGFDGSPASVGYLVPRVTGFTANYVFVEGRYLFSGLTTGGAYFVRIFYGRRVYGTSDPFVGFATEDVPFTATGGGSEYTAFIDLPIEDGFETNVLAAFVYHA